MELVYTILLAAAAALASWFLLPRPWARSLLGLGRRAAGLRSRRAQVDGQTWHYLTGGDGPVLVAVHGFGGDADNWLRMAPFLRRHFRIIAPDLIGFGSSDDGKKLPFDIDSQSLRLVRFLDGLGVDEFIIAGNSMGGWIATRIAETCPGRVRALWLLAPLGVADCRPAELLEAIGQDSDRNPLRAATPRDFEQKVFRPMFAHAPWLPRPLKLHYADQARKLGVHAAERFRNVRQSEPPLETTIARLSLPILLQWGDRDRAVDISGLETLRLASERVESEALADVGHLPMLEAPRAVAARFLQFAKRHGLRAPAN